jgi:hypothetical protein
MKTYTHDISTECDTYDRLQYGAAMFEARNKVEGCTGCAFVHGPVDGFECDDTPYCSSAWRDDGRGVIWVRATAPTAATV